MLDEDWLVLSTMHSAKGLEFDAVYVIHAADGNIPRDMATGRPSRSTRSGGSSTWRARAPATISTSRTPALLHPAQAVDPHGYAQLTRFVSDRVIPHLVEVQASPASAADDEAQPRTTSADVRGGVRRLW